MDQTSSDWFYGELSELLLITHFGELRPAEKGIPFLRRVLQRDEAGIHLQAPKANVLEMVDTLGQRTGKEVRAMGIMASAKNEGGTTHVDYESRRIFRRVVGKLVCLAPIRPELSSISVSKELSRTLWSPSFDGFAKLKHAIHYLKGTEDYRLTMRPDTTKPSGPTRRDRQCRLRLGRLLHYEKMYDRMHDHGDMRRDPPLLASAYHGGIVFR